MLQEKKRNLKKNYGSPDRKKKREVSTKGKGCCLWCEAEPRKSKISKRVRNSEKVAKQHKKSFKVEAQRPKISISPVKVFKEKNQNSAREKNISTFKSLKNFVHTSSSGYKNNLNTRVSLTKQKMSPLIIKGKMVEVRRNERESKRGNQVP